MAAVLHILPTNALGSTYAGCYKDVITRIRWFEAHVDRYRRVEVQDDRPDALESTLDTFRPTHVLVEYSHFPRIVKRVKAKRPDAWVGVRAHNIEPLQHLDNHGWWSARGPLWMAYGMGRLLCADASVKRHADAILSINEWENRAYWDRLPGRARVTWLPYVCPEHLVPREPLPYAQRRTIACLPTSQKNRKSIDVVLRFQALAADLKRRGCADDFVITGGAQNWNLPTTSAVSHAGFIEDLAGFMGACRAVALLSPLGYGFKTTVADALAAGCHVLAHPSLARRMPAEVARHVLPIDTAAAGDLQRVRDELERAPDGANVQQELKRRSEEQMARYFGGRAS